MCLGAAFTACPEIKEALNKSILFHARTATVAAIRQQALDEHYTRHPERYVNGAPIVALPPAAVHINPDLAMEASQLLDTAGALRMCPTPVDTVLPEVVT